MASRVKSSTLYVGNLPVDATRTEVEEVFGEVGPIKKCFVLKAKGEASAYAFVTYALPEDTDTAAEELKDATIRGNQLKVSISNRKQKLKQSKNEHEQKPAKKPEPVAVESKKKLKASLGAAVSTPAHGTLHSKKGRLIVRNLPFKVTDESFRKHFASVGPITETKLLKKPNGLLVGCGFVQYKHEKHAEEAIRKYNTKPFLGRPIVIDWAVDKARYEAAQVPSQDASKGRKRPLDEDDEPAPNGRIETSESSRVVTSDGESDDGEDASEEEDEDVSDDDQEGSKEEQESGEPSSGEGEEEESDGSDAESEEGGSEQDSEDDEGSDVESAEDGEEMEHDGDTVEEKPSKRPKQKSSDVSDGSTLFVKNMSFDTDQETLKRVFSQYGRVKYALICVDPLTEHPRGTAFVQFKSAEEAAAALAAAADPENAAHFTLDDRRVEVLPAVDRDELKRKKQLEKGRLTEGKDKRNLYLAREGLVREGSRAAEGVSRADINKRIGLEKWKTKMLKNLNMFVSNTRLCVHNLPVDVDDSRLRQIFCSHAPAEAQISEARVMRDRRDVSTHPRGQSKEYGFVTFTQHEHSLTALRNINNNPEIFTVKRRPIVEFAVENRTALDARRRREEKSRQMNAAAGAPATVGGGSGKNKRRRTATEPSGSAPARRGPASARTGPAPAGPARPAHAGMAADRANKALPKLKTRPGAQESAKAITRRMLKAGKKGRRRERAGQKRDVVQDWEQTAVKKKNSRREKKKALKGRQKERPDDTKFTSLVDKYRQKLAAAPATGSRWFQ